MGYIRGTPERRLSNKIRVDFTTGCWLWIAATGRGYARFNVGGKVIELHRWMYELFIGPIPTGLHIDHLCRNRNCLNPHHMEPVSNHVNMLRGNSSLATKARQTHCLHGHPFDKENTYYHPQRKTRHCRACHKLRDQKRRQLVSV